MLGRLLPIAKRHIAVWRELTKGHLTTPLKSQHAQHAGELH
jgi:hypothetical protein